MYNILYFPGFKISNFMKKFSAFNEYQNHDFATLQDCVSRAPGQSNRRRKKAGNRTFLLSNTNWTNSFDFAVEWRTKRSQVEGDKRAKMILSNRKLSANRGHLFKRETGKTFFLTVAKLHKQQVDGMKKKSKKIKAPLCSCSALNR